MPNKTQQWTDWKKFKQPTNKQKPIMHISLFEPISQAKIRLHFKNKSDSIFKIKYALRAKPLINCHKK
jgi:hypothetical protein